MARIDDTEPPNLRFVRSTQMTNLGNKSSNIHKQKAPRHQRPFVCFLPFVEHGQYKMDN